MKRERYDEGRAEQSGLERKSSSHKRSHDYGNRPDEERERKKYSKEKEKNGDKYSENAVSKYDNKSYSRNQDRTSRYEDKQQHRHGDKSYRSDDKFSRHDESCRDKNYKRERDMNDKQERNRTSRHVKEKDSDKYTKSTFSKDKSFRKSKFDIDTPLVSNEVVKEAKVEDEKKKTLSTITATDHPTTGRTVLNGEKVDEIEIQKVKLKEKRLSPTVDENMESKMDDSKPILSDKVSTHSYQPPTTIVTPTAAATATAVATVASVSVSVSASASASASFTVLDKSKSILFNGFTPSSSSSSLSSAVTHSASTVPPGSLTLIEKKTKHVSNWDQSRQNLPAQNDILTHQMLASPFTSSSSSPSPSPQLIALLAAKKAAEMVNQNMGIASVKDVEAKKKLLWGNKKTIKQDNSNVGLNRWDTVHFSDPTREEKFHKLMGVKSDAPLSKTAPTFGGNPPNSGDSSLPFAEEEQEKIQYDLEKQFEMGLRRRGGGSTNGLGL